MHRQVADVLRGLNERVADVVVVVKPPDRNA